MFITLEEAGAAVARIQPHEWIWIAIGSWMLLGALAASALGRMIRAAQAEDVTYATDWRPPVPPSHLTDAQVDARIPALEALFAEADQ